MAALLIIAGLISNLIELELIRVKALPPAQQAQEAQLHWELVKPWLEMLNRLRVDFEKLLPPSSAPPPSTPPHA